MAICTLTQTTSMAVGTCKKRKRVGKYNKPTEDNKKKLELYLSKNGK